MTRSILVGLACSALLLQLVGCAAQSNNQTKQINELSEQVRRLQATTDHLQERMSALENLRARESERSSRQVPAATPGVPDLPVVKMTPDARAGTSDAPAANGETEEPRPLIVGEGSRIETRSSGEPIVAPRRSKDKVSDTTSKRPSSAPESGKK